VKKYYALLSILLLCFCSTRNQETEKLPIKKAKLSIAITHKTPINIEEPFLENIENWKEYKLLEEFAVKFYRTSPNEALSNALEMKSLVTSLKDSIKPTIFNTPSFNARINVLFSEAERLADITFIPAIKTVEINEQVEKTLNAFSALNAKINTVLSQKKFEDAIGVSSSFIGLDTTKMDRISRKTVAVFDKKIKTKRASKKKAIQTKSVLPDYKNTKRKKSFQKLKLNN
jgi:hypothetical protein|tara:strand:+ start:485 stop:1174 length:690 start_codon:yes stop_codon:yes gene_type:complete